MAAGRALESLGRLLRPTPPARPGGAWRKPAVSARRAAELRKEVLAAGGGARPPNPAPPLPPRPLSPAPYRPSAPRGLALLPAVGPCSALALGSGGFLRAWVAGGASRRSRSPPPLPQCPARG